MRRDQRRTNDDSFVPGKPMRIERLSLDNLVPHANLEPTADGPYRWQATNSDPQFQVVGAESLAGKWVVLTIEISFAGDLRFPIMLYPDNGAGLSEADAFRLYPDTLGRVRYAWKASPGLRAIRFDPIAQTGEFTLRVFRLETQSAGLLYLSAAGIVIGAGVRAVVQRLMSAARNCRSNGWAIALSALVRTHNESAVVGQADRVRGHRLRLRILEQHAADIYLRASGKTNWNSRHVTKVTDQIDPDNLPLRVIANYLPHYYPAAETAAWRGLGYTDWLPVAGAQPQFIGHYQPHLPGELGFYDQRTPQNMRDHVALARQYGIAGFCFHYYWFNGKPLLGTPLGQFLAEPNLKARFCISWANVDWKTPRTGLDPQVHLSHQCSASDDVAFIASLANAFADLRYIKIDGKPLVIVQHMEGLASAWATTSRWRKWADEAGLPGLFLLAGRSADGPDPRADGFDGVMERPLPTAADQVATTATRVNPDNRGSVHDYSRLASARSFDGNAQHPVFRTVLPGWDDEPANPGAGRCFAGASPEVYAGWLHAAGKLTIQKRDAERILFVHAWNDWANGAHLEPDRHFGYAYLHATANALKALTATAVSDIDFNVEFAKSSDIAVILHIYYEDLIAPIFASWLSPLVGLVDVFATIKGDMPRELLLEMKNRFPSIYFIATENRGRDIRPFLIAYQQVHALGYSLVCKIHGKKSPHLADGEAQREYLMGALLGSRDSVLAIARAFSESETLGLLYPARANTDLGEHAIHAGNTRWLDILLARLQYSATPEKYGFTFPAGSMYWFRSAALLPLLDQSILSMEEFELEAGQLDGTLAHAIERLIGLVAAREGFEASPL